MKIGNLIHRFVYPKWYRENGIKYTKFDIISQVIMGIGVIGSGLIVCIIDLTGHAMTDRELYTYITTALIGMLLIILIDRAAIKRRLDELNKEKKL